MAEAEMLSQRCHKGLKLELFYLTGQANCCLGFIQMLAKEVCFSYSCYRSHVLASLCWCILFNKGGVFAGEYGEATELNPELCK